MFSIQMHCLLPMDTEWALTLACNIVLMALLIAVRPPRCRILTIYVIHSLICDWFFLANKIHLHDELYNVPFMLMDRAAIGLETAAFLEVLLAHASFWSMGAFSGMILHTILRLREHLVWNSFTGRFRFLLYLNVQGWNAFHQRQQMKVVSTALLIAFILSERNQREGATYDGRSIQP